MSADTPEGIYELPPREDAPKPRRGFFQRAREAAPPDEPLAPEEADDQADGQVCNQADGQADAAAADTIPDAEAHTPPPAPAPPELKALPSPQDAASGNEDASEGAAAIDAAAQDALDRRRQERKSHTGTIAVTACVAALLALTMLGSVMNVGDHLAAAHPVLGWVFYALIVALVAVGIVVPVVKVARRPIFSLYQLRDEKGRAKRRRCQMLADNLIANTSITDEEIEELRQIMQKGDDADDLLIEFFERHCIPAIDAETKRAASTAFFVAAISRSPLISTVTMLSVCLDLVRSIVETCGFRPTNLGLARLYTRVMLSALIIGGIEDSDLSDLLGQLMGGGAGARAGGIVLGATAEGLVSAFLVFRVGVLTKKWLTAADGPVSMQAIRRTSYREALAMMRTDGFMQVVADTVKQTTGAVATGVASTVKHTTESVAANIADSMSNAARSTMEAVKSAFR